MKIKTILFQNGYMGTAPKILAIFEDESEAIIENDMLKNIIIKLAKKNGKLHKEPRQKISRLLINI